MERRRLYETWPPEGGRAPRQAAADPAMEVQGDGLLLDAHIRPNRSLAGPGFYALMGALIAISFTAGIAFVSMGAWPVIGFFGLDILLVWLCFRLSYRDGRRLEIVQVTPQDIRVARRWPTGHERWYRMPAAWTRVEVDGAGEPDVQTRLTAMGKHLIIGAMLSPREREALGAAVRDALDKARRPAAAARAQESGGAA